MQKTAYALAIEIHQQIVGALKPGVVLKELYCCAKETVAAKNPDLASKFVTSAGFGMGLEFNDMMLVCNDKCDRKVVAGTPFCISVGFSEPAGKTPWAVWIANTVLVPHDGGPCQVLTEGSSFAAKDVMYELGGDDEDTASVAAAPAPPPAAPKAAPAKGKAAAKPEAKAKAKAGAKPPGAPKPAAKSPAKGAAAASSASAAKAPAPRAAPGPAAAAPQKGRSSKGVASPPARTSSTRASRPAADTPPDVNPERIIGSRFRNRTTAAKQDMKDMAQIEEAQVGIRSKKLQELRERFAGVVQEQEQGPAGPKALVEYKAYASPAHLPAVEPRPNRLHMDSSADALLVPMHGALVPFHVSTIKNMARSTLDNFQLLRVNFFTPGQGKSADDFPEPTPARVYVKEFTFRSEHRDNLDAVMRGFKDSQKRLKMQEQEVQKAAPGARSRQPVPIVPLQTSRSAVVLRDVNVRPTIGAGSRRTVGSLEAHVNGFRFSIRGGSEKVDVLYAQIKHAIFQPCERGSLIVLVHFHLWDPMTVGKKTTQDLQFFSECGSLTEDLTQKRASSAYDPDEILEEQNERQLIEARNKMYLEFCKQVKGLASCPLDFDMAKIDAGFTGVPARSQVDLTFSTKCLVALQEWPPICVDMSEVDVVVFERAILTLREFDMVLVHKNYQELPLRITTIPKKFFDGIKRWLGKAEMPWYSCAMSMQWPMVMKDISKDLSTFLDNGGWDAWFATGAADSDSDAEGDQESDFSGGDSDDDDEEDGGDDGESDFASEDQSEDSAAGGGGSDEDGESWDELEAKADRADKKRDREVSPSPTRGKTARQPPTRAKRVCRR
mmetsp:Transcript_34459/g.112155  ORF Transcript_34459/g.112155 Transcript_34459/m.112155 type:complete len:835 (+) Transcript_34459:3052-5556(+)